MTNIRAQRGTKDIFGEEILTWQWIEENAKRVFQNAGFVEIRTPIFEATELFSRGVGDSTDIVNKKNDIINDVKTSIDIFAKQTNFNNLF